MSSTNRGGKRSPSDLYPTPPWCTYRLVERLVFPTNGVWFEPCAGEGAIIQACTDKGLTPYWIANELRPEAAPVLSLVNRRGRNAIGDILDPSTRLPSGEDVTVIITNPPYRIAWELLHKMLREFPQAYIALLLRVNFYASQERHHFMSNYAPDIYVLPNRPGFKAWGKTDSPEYGWFVWPPSPRARTRGVHELLDLTPLEERKRVSDAQIVYPEGV